MNGGRLKRRKRLKPSSVATARAFQQRGVRRWRGKPKADPSFHDVVGPCEVCGERPATCGHHVFKQQWLRDYHRSRVARALRVRPLKALLSDVRNRMQVCEECHDAHERHCPAIPRAKVPASAWEFTAELGPHAHVRLEGDYPA